MVEVRTEHNFSPDQQSLAEWAPPRGWTVDDLALSDPSEIFANLQRSAPVYYEEEMGAFLITRYEDVVQLLGTDGLSAGSVGKFFDRMPTGLRSEFSQLENFFNAWMVFSDPPHHTNLRQTFGPAFSAKATRIYQEQIEEIAEQTISGAVKSGTDLISEVIHPYAFSSLSIYLGLREEHFSDAKRWCDDLIGFIGTSEPEVERAELAQQSLLEFQDFLVKEIVPQVNGTDASPVLRCGATLSQTHFAGMYAQILTGSFDPVTNALGIGLFEITRNARNKELLESGAVSISSAVEEILRYSTPFRLVSRVANRDIQLRGETIPLGSRVFLMLVAANRDEREFDKPLQFDLELPRSRHLSFGFGPRYCLGAAMARLQINIAVRALLPEIRGLEPENSTLILEPTFGASTLRSLVLQHSQKTEIS